MRIHIFYLSILSAMLIAMSIQHCNSVFKPTLDDDIAKVLADMPNHTESDRRKRETFADACLSIADLIQSGAITDTEEVTDAFRIETANLRSGEPWSSIQRRIEALLRKAESLAEQEALLLKVQSVIK